MKNKETGSVKLYHHSGTRSDRPLWLLEELNVPYELEDINIFAGEGKAKSYQRINPYGKVPALDDQGTVILEAGAICLYLTDKYPEKNLAPGINTPERGLYYQWMFFTPANLEPPLTSIFLHTYLLSEEARQPLFVEASKKQFNRIVRVLNQEFEGKLFLLGEQFSTADIMLASTLMWFPELIEDYTELNNYVLRATDRPAYRRMRNHSGLLDMGGCNLR